MTAKRILELEVCRSRKLSFSLSSGPIPTHRYTAPSCNSKLKRQYSKYTKTYIGNIINHQCHQYSQSPKHQCHQYSQSPKHVHIEHLHVNSHVSTVKWQQSRFNSDIITLERHSSTVMCQLMPDVYWWPMTIPPSSLLLTEVVSEGQHCHEASPLEKGW